MWVYDESGDCFRSFGRKGGRFTFGHVDYLILNSMIVPAPVETAIAL
jgi:hypothetical protein